MTQLIKQRIRIGGWGVLVFLLLAVRFSPNWFLFYQGIQDAMEHAPTPPDRLAVRRVFADSLPLLRGAYVAAQVTDLQLEIGSPNHKIVRWRLLMPAIGHFLRLSPWVVLGFAPAGCLALIVAFVALGCDWAKPSKKAFLDAASLACIAGASAPFFTSMGWLGYYDSWLALALLGVAFVRSRALVALACLLAPWIDERFVIGLPLALLVRGLYFVRDGKIGLAWLRAEALPPLLLVFFYSLVRLHLGGTGGSQTVGEYLRDFVFSETLPAGRRFYGAWQGLRLGWILVLVALVLPLGAGAPPGAVARQVSFGALTLLTAVVGIVTAQDMSRSMVLVFPAMFLGWFRATRADWWARYRVGPVLAILALLLPATQVAGSLLIPVDNLWSHPHALTTNQGFVGLKYLEGDGLTRDYVEGVRLVRKAADQGDASAQFNLGAFYAAGTGLPKDDGKAAEWFRKAADQGLADAQSNLGAMYDNGLGVPPDPAEALRWYRRAAGQRCPDGLSNLGSVYERGAGLPKDEIEALAYYKLAAALGSVAGEQRRAKLEKQLGAEKSAIADRRSQQLLK